MPVKHTTRNYHLYGSPDLMTELTICESFASSDSPYMIVLEYPGAYGAMIGDFLVSKNLLCKGSRILEAGGGYGTLMKGLLQAHSNLVDTVYMTDISMNMLNRQRKTLFKWKNIIRFIQADISDFISSISNINIVIFNEMIGDLDVITGLNADDLPEDISELIRKYELEIPGSGSFSLNIGAIKLIESLCKKRIPVLITEHSSDPIIPESMKYLEQGLDLDSFPREIRLYKHSEYTIRFSHLINIAGALGRKVATGPLIELTGIKKTPEMRFVFTSRACNTERQQIIYELLDHIREYRWLIIE